MTPNTDNPDKPQANQGDDELDKRLREILSSYARYISLDNQSDMWKALETQLVALHHRQLAERLQQILDSPVMQREEHPTNRSQRARNILRSALRDIITELMSPQSFDPTEISLCPSCNQMTHTLANGICGKCRAYKHELMP
jgi:hypothetical protein